MKATSTLALLAVGLASAGPALASDWPQYRGPSRHGTARADPTLLTTWETTQPRELWRRPIGAGYSAVTVVGDRVYLMDAAGGQDVVLCLDAADGSEIWRTPLGQVAVSDMDDNGPRSTPAVVDGQVYTASSAGRLVALAASDGSLSWEYDLMAGGKAPRFGYSVSPLVDGDQLLIEGGSAEEQPGIYAFDRDTGELRWTALSGPAGYSSPIAVDLGGRRQYVFFRRAGAEVVALGTDGEVLWRHTTAALAIITTPLFVPPNRFFVASADDVFGGLMLEVTESAGVFQAEELWSERLMRNHFNTSVAVGGHLYGFDNGTLRCLDAQTGAKRWAKRGLGKGSLIAAGELLYVLSDDGTLVLVAASPEEFHEKGRMQATSGRTWTAPSYAAGRLYVRDFDEIVAFDLRAPAPGSTGSPPQSRPGGTAMNRHLLTGLTVSLLIAAAATAEEPVAAPSAEEIVARYVAARGGAERWREAHALRAVGNYSAFSFKSEFTLIHQSGDLYRLDFDMLQAPAVRARDSAGAWALHKLLWPEPTRLDDSPYRPQLERESAFGSLLLDPAARGLAIESLGPGEIDGIATLGLKVTLPDGREETWHLDAGTYLEVAVESEVVDFTQASEPVHQRTFFDDFRPVDGLVLPHWVEHEFNHRLESMTIERWEVNPDLGPEAFSPPPTD